MKAEILQLKFALFVVDLSSGLPGGQIPDVAPFTSNFRPTILAKVGCTTFCFW